MTSDPQPLPPDRAELVDQAARWLADRPHSMTPIPDAIAEFELSVSEACRAVGLAANIRNCREAFA